MVSAFLRALIGADFSLAVHIRRLFYGFGPFTDTARDALTYFSGRAFRILDGR
jgi:hypothetical protein